MVANSLFALQLLLTLMGNMLFLAKLAKVIYLSFIYCLGIEVLDKMEKIKTDPDDKPLTDIIIADCG